jgi:DNA/RNA endonuclease YhcR with UshA esterase domain
MKTIFNKTIIMITASLFLSMNINAKDNENPKSVLISYATKTIKEHIKFPNFLIHFNEEEKVNVVFTVNETGEVNLVIANTANETIKKSIETQFMKLKLNKLKANNAYSVVFNFKTI